jgi:hypothetical protein
MARTRRDDPDRRARVRRPGARALVDEMMDRYTDWREACHVVEVAYRRWDQAAAKDAALAHAGYVAALDLEAHAAGAYAELVQRARRIHLAPRSLAASGA